MRGNAGIYKSIDASCDHYSLSVTLLFGLYVCFSSSLLTNNYIFSMASSEKDFHHNRCQNGFKGMEGTL